MRSLFVLALVAACNSSSEPGPGIDAVVHYTPDATCAPGSPCEYGEVSCDIPEPSGLVNHWECVMSADFYVWRCSDCPFAETSDPVSCATPGIGCTIENWEHDCACECTTDGWWNCTPGTIGSHCPTHP